MAAAAADYTAAAAFCLLSETAKYTAPLRQHVPKKEDLILELENFYSGQQQQTQGQTGQIPGQT